jgi:hypothetical protein
LNASANVCDIPNGTRRNTIFESKNSSALLLILVRPIERRSRNSLRRFSEESCLLAALKQKGGKQVRLADFAETVVWAMSDFRRLTI